MTQTATSPGDPVFFLHHVFINMLWAKWQLVDPSNRTYWIGGNNVQSIFSGSDAEHRSFKDYDGDNGGNITTLNHTLWVAGLADNIATYDVMNISNALNCAQYVYLDDI